MKKINRRRVRGAAPALSASSAALLRGTLGPWLRACVISLSQLAWQLSLFEAWHDEPAAPAPDQLQAGQVLTSEVFCTR